MRSNLWTVIGSVTTIIGVAAALYPLLVDRTEYLHVSPGSLRLDIIESGEVVNQVDSKSVAMKFQSLTEPVILTGKIEVISYSLERDFFWTSGSGAKFTADFGRLTKFYRELPLTTAKTEQVFVQINPHQLSVERSKAHCVRSCPTVAGNVKLQFEYSTKNGRRLVDSEVPFCLLGPGAPEAIDGAGCSLSEAR